MRPGTRPLLLALCAVFAAAGCGSDRTAGLPAECPEDAQQVLSALAAAPSPVRVHGVALSECLTKGSSGDQVQRIGSAYVTAAGKLSGRAARDPGGPDALRLGYLVGAARRGAARTEGVHSELIRRLDQELGGVRRTSAVRRGLRAGRATG